MSDQYNQRWVTLVEHKVYLSIGSGNVTLERLKQFDDDVLNLFVASSAPLVHIISDTREVATMPSLTDVMKTRYLVHPRMGYIITIGAFRNSVLRFLFSMSTAITKTRYKDAVSLREACGYLLERDPSLPPLEAWSLPADADEITAAS